MKKSSSFAIADAYLRSSIPAQHFASVTQNTPTEMDFANVRAVLIDSEVLGAPLWLTFDESFDPEDGIPVFYPDELQFLKDKSVATLRKIYETKRSLGLGTRTRQ